MRAGSRRHYLGAVDARRTLFRLRVEALDAEESYHVARANLARWVASPF